jgi:hypothetical protein
MRRQFTGASFECFVCGAIQWLIIVACLVAFSSLAMGIPFVLIG